MSIFALSLPLLKAPKGWKRARYIYIKGVTERFGFDGRRISQIQTVSQKQSNGNASWADYMQSSLAILGDSHFLRVHYILIGVGLSALLVSTIRAMREPYYVERASDWLHVFLYVLTTSFSIRLFGATGAKHFRMRGLFASFRYFESWNQSVLISATCKWLYPP